MHKRIRRFQSGGFLGGVPVAPGVNPNAPVQGAFGTPYMPPLPFGPSIQTGGPGAPVTNPGGVQEFVGTPYMPPLPFGPNVQTGGPGASIGGRYSHQAQPYNAPVQEFVGTPYMPPVPYAPVNRQQYSPQPQPGPQMGGFGGFGGFGGGVQEFVGTPYMPPVQATPVQRAPMAPLRSTPRARSSMRNAPTPIMRRAPNRRGMKSGGQVTSPASKRGDGCAMKGKTRGKFV